VRHAEGASGQESVRTHARLMDEVIFSLTRLVAADATDPGRSARLAHRMRCCLDRWWLPAGIPEEPNCVRDFGGDGCDPRLDCRL